MILNVGPKGDGSIPEEDKRILKEIGVWLERNGEAIYGTYAWREYAEGVAKLPEGHGNFQWRDQGGDDIACTKQEIRRECLHARLMTVGGCKKSCVCEK